MNLINFKIAEDNIALEQDGNYLDLHNCYDFVSVSYDMRDRSVHLSWTRSIGDWVPTDLPKTLNLFLTKVYLFKVKERDPELPFCEDTCLSSLGFLWNDLIEEMEGYTSHEPKKDCTHLNMEFQNGLALKIGAESAKLSTRPLR